MSGTPDRLMEQAREALIEAVHEVNGDKPGGHTRGANIIARALASAHQEGRKDGMKRAAEIVRDRGPASQDMTSTMICDALDEAADAILSEIDGGTQ